MKSASTNSIVKAFSEIRWADLALRTIGSRRKDEIDDLVLEIVGLYWEVGTRFELCFEDTTYVEARIDFAAKRACSDAFDGAFCRLDSSWKKGLSDANPYDDFSSYLHFGLGLVPKGGKIDVLARSFTFRRL